MIEKVINGISATIDNYFDSEYPIYAEDIEQGLQEPCFFIAVLAPTHKQMLGNRYLLTIPVDVHYFPGTANKHLEINRVAAQLMYLLRRITLTDGQTQLNGFDMHYEVVENVLHFFVTYKPFVQYPVEAVTLMDDLTQNQESR